jgi:hypothetical protein
MKRVKAYYKIALMFFLLSSLPLPATDIMVKPITAELSEEIISRIRRRAITGYRRYRGIETKREINTKEYNAKTGELISTSRALIIYREYFYEIPETEVLGYIKDGQEKPASDYRKSKEMPGYQIFDEEGAKRYQIEVVGYRTIKNQRCYQIEVTPKQKTRRHFKGAIFARVDNLEIVSIEGTIGNFPLGVKELSTKLSTTASGDLTVLKSGIIKLRIYFPLLYPDTRIVTSIKVLGHRLILR